jgi:NAD(P)-dependent dehydrogenase (short-subunit alcohol dehydrogenase family)
MRRRESFAGRTVLITGAASGIGRATALAVAGRGSRVVLTDVSPLDDVVREAGDAVAHSAQLDITDHEAVQQLAADAGAVDIVMNVAGISTWGSVDRLRHEDWRAQIEVNLMGPINVIEAFVPPLIARGRGGHLVNVSSAAGYFGLPWHAAYSASKFGLRGVSEVLRFDLRPHGIGVTLVCPGAVDTGLVRTLHIAGIDREHPAVAALTKRFQGHAVTPEHVARCIIDGVERNRYLVVTSRDIRLGVLAQRYFPPGYELAMRTLNRQLVKVGERAAV